MWSVRGLGRRPRPTPALWPNWFPLTGSADDDHATFPGRRRTAPRPAERRPAPHPKTHESRHHTFDMTQEPEWKVKCNISIPLSNRTIIERAFQYKNKVIERQRNVFTYSMNTCDDSHQPHNSQRNKGLAAATRQQISYADICSYR